MVMTAEIIAMAPAKMIGIKSQIRPAMPPAKARVAAVPIVPTPRIVATMPAKDMLAICSLMVPFVIAAVSIFAKTLRRAMPRILLRSTANVQIV